MKPPCRRNQYKKRRTTRPVIEVARPARCPLVSNQPSSLIVGKDEEHGEYSYMYGDTQVEENPREVLRKWLRGQKFLLQDLSDDFLGIFLWAADWNADLASELLLKYFYARQEPSLLFRNRDPLNPENQKILSELYVLPMPELTKDGTKVIMTGLVKPHVKYNQMDHLKLFALTFDLLIWDQRFGYGDFCIVFDATNFQCPQLLENKFRDGKSIGSFFTDSIPGALKSFYLFNPPAYISHVADSRNEIWVTVVKDVSELIQFIPPETLPEEYGGTCGSFEDLHERWVKHINDSRDFFVAFENKMIQDYERRICNEKEKAGKGKNWVQDMKLEADEWEYKIQYYERMRTMEPFTHPAFGMQRLENLFKAQHNENEVLGDQLKMRKKAEEEFSFPESELVIKPSKKDFPAARKTPDADAKLLLELHLFI